jgi:hypothetical protein
MQCAHRRAVNESWHNEQRAREIGRLQAILRDVFATTEEKSIASAQLNYWQTPEDAQASSNTEYGFQIRGRQ